jgi:hypothetical protein
LAATGKLIFPQIIGICRRTVEPNTLSMIILRSTAGRLAAIGGSTVERYTQANGSAKAGAGIKHEIATPFACAKTSINTIGNN